MAPVLVDPAFQSIDSAPTTSVKQTAKPANAHNYIPGRTTVTKHDDTYEFEHLRPRFPDITWPALTETPYSDKGLLGDVSFKHLLASATEVFDYNPKIGTEIHGVDLANLTDPAAKGFEDRVIRVLESLVPATKNTSPTPADSNQRYPQQKVRVNP